ncbi:MAG: translation initiation factor [Mariprofundaceae bacterium]
MNNDKRLVYSTEHGQLDKTMSKPAGKKKRNKKNASTTPAITNPNKQGIRIRRESKGRGGKNVSVIDGLALDEKELKILLKKLKAKLGSGGAVKAGCLEIQGDHREKIQLLLEKEGYNSKLAGG